MPFSSFLRQVHRILPFANDAGEGEVHLPLMSEGPRCESQGALLHMQWVTPVSSGQALQGAWTNAGKPQSHLFLSTAQSFIIGAKVHQFGGK